MNIQILVVLGILAVLAISGCTGSAITKPIQNAIVCESEWIKLQQPVAAMTSDLNKINQSLEDSCKGACYKEYKVTKFNADITIAPYMGGYAYCYCDVNNC